MKKLVQVQEVEGQGLIGLLEQSILLNTQDYFIFGTLTGVNDVEIQITNPRIVLDIRWSEKGFQDAPPMGMSSINIRLSAIQWYGPCSRT